MNGPNPLLEAPLPPAFEAPATRPTSPPATPGAPSPPFAFYKRMSTPQLAESPPLEFGEPTGRDRPIRPLSHVSSRESLHVGAHARDDLSVASAGDTGSVSEVLSPCEEVPISPIGNIELDVEEVPEDDPETHSGLEIVQPDDVEEPSLDRDRQRNGDDSGIATRFQDLNCDGDESGKSLGERQRRFLQRKRRRMDRRFKRTFSEIEGSDTDDLSPADSNDRVSPARRLRRKMNSPANEPCSLFDLGISNLPTRENEAVFPISASGSFISRPTSTVSDSEGWTALPFNASGDIMDVDSQASGVQLAPSAPAPPQPPPPTPLP